MAAVIDVAVFAGFIIAVVAATLVLYIIFW